MKFKAVLLLVLCCSLLLSLAGCATGSKQAADDHSNRYGGHANIRITGISGLDPLTQTGYNNYQWTTMVYENALTRDNENNIQPGVCNFSLSEDELTLVLWVRDGVRFHNGDTVDIYDVEASLHRAFKRYGSIKNKVTPYLKSMSVDESGEKITLQFTQWREDTLYYLASYRTWCPIMPKEICLKYTDKNLSTDIADCIGTGPYSITDYKRHSYITVTRFADYTTLENGLTGFAGPKYAYLDSVTFWNVSTDKTACEGLISGKYDVTDCMLSTMEGAMEQNNITSTDRNTNAGWYMIFNPYGSSSVCNRYPSLRKAVMAAIDTEALLSELTSGQYIAATTPVLDSNYNTDIFSNADYMGCTNSQLIQQYAEQARKEGWNGTDPVIIVPFDHNDDATSQLEIYLKDAGIPVTIVEESNPNLTWRKKADSKWDVYFYNAAFSTTPSLTQDVIAKTYWQNDRKDEILEQMKSIRPEDAQYQQLWLELAQLWVDDCAVPFLGFETGTIYHKNTLHNNEDEGSYQRYWFNAYWDDPENHTA